jgi:hypothetical protein
MAADSAALTGTGSEPCWTTTEGAGSMHLILFILRLLLDLLVGWWRDAAPLVVRRDGRLQTWQEDEAAEAVVGLGVTRLFPWLAAPLRARPPVRRSPGANASRADGG